MSTLARPVSDRFHDALAYASEMHADQSRKGGEIPYVAHLMAVSVIVMEARGTEDEAIAALLHDGPEDQGGLERLADIRDRFGDRVAGIVEHCSDTFETPKPSWLDRKRRYVESLASADASTLLVSVADKLHNARSTLRDLQAAADPATVWRRFKGTPEQTIANYRALIDAYTRGTPDARRDPIVHELRNIIDAIEAN
jgi:(p)ppGpp synthase/HD superfamily hydrolase